MKSSPYERGDSANHALVRIIPVAMLRAVGRGSILPAAELLATTKPPLAMGRDAGHRNTDHDGAGEKQTGGCSSTAS